MSLIHSHVAIVFRQVGAGETEDLESCEILKKRFETFQTVSHSVTVYLSIKNIVKNNVTLNTLPFFSSNSTSTNSAISQQQVSRVRRRLVVKTIRTNVVLN